MCETENTKNLKLIFKVIELNKSPGSSVSISSDLIKVKKPKIVIICNPNNPTGIYCKYDEIENLAIESSESGSILMIDEAYLSFVENPWESISLLKYPNTILVRSMSKDYHKK